MATRLFVGNLPLATQEKDLRAAFSSYGDITNLDLKSKSTADENKKFAFVTLSGTNYNIESCIKYFASEDFNGNRLYVTRARESFLERLQRERLEANQKEAGRAEVQEPPIKTPVIKLGKKLNPQKRKIENDSSINHRAVDHTRILENENVIQNGEGAESKRTGNVLEVYKRKQDSETKRMEAMKQKRNEFKQKQMIVKTGLTRVDKAQNKKIKFSDSEDDTPQAVTKQKGSKPDKKNTLFDEDDEDENINDEVNFKIKKQFEGKKGQKVLDLQSRYKSDKRFVLDERFIEEEEDGAEHQKTSEEQDQIEVNQTDEKEKQLNILQDVLGVAIKRKITEDERDVKKYKPKIGMLRFDPSQPEHAKFLAPIEDTKQEYTKKSKKKTKDKQADEAEVTKEQKQEDPRPEVSKEQFYKVSETLKQAIAQPTSFSLRSLFGNTENAEQESKEEEANYKTLVAPKKTKVKNPLEPGERNPFIYDSSDSENEEVEKETKSETAPVVTESKAVWKESFFFGLSDQRFQEGLAFFTSNNKTEAHKERRELKSLMKKRIYNKERKNQMQMFQKKIGGRKKTMKKIFRKN